MFHVYVYRANGTSPHITISEPTLRAAFERACSTVRRMDKRAHGYSLARWYTTANRACFGHPDGCRAVPVRTTGTY